MTVIEGHPLFSTGKAKDTRLILLSLLFCLLREGFSLLSDRSHDSVVRENARGATKNSKVHTPRDQEILRRMLVDLHFGF